MDKIQHSCKKKSRIESNLKKQYKPRLEIELQLNKKIIVFLILLISILAFFSVQKNTILAYFVDIKTLDNSFIIDADYTVSFSSNTGIGTMLNQEISYNVGTSLNKNTFTKEGYNFIGWNTEADGTGASYIDEDNVTNIGDVTLYAQWEEKKYDITYFFRR